MGAPGQHAEHILGTDDGGRKAQQRAVDGRDQQQAARLQDGRRLAQERLQTVDMLHHLEQQQHVEGITGAQRSIGRTEPVVDVQAPVVGVQPRGGDVVRRGIHAHHVRPAASQWLTHQSGSAADVSDPQPGKITHRSGETASDLLEYVAQPQCVDDMQRSHRTRRVPPGCRQSVETLDFVGPNGAGGHQ